MSTNPAVTPGPDDPVLTTRVLAPIAAGGTDIGQREHNEDHVLLRPELGLYILADGAGGHNAGNIASALATSTVANLFETTASSLITRPEVDQFGLWTIARRLSAAIHSANSEIVDIAKRAKKYHGMGSTVVALAFSPEGDMVHVAHVGDSRCYRMRHGILERLTTDHSLMVDVLETHPDADDALVERMPQNIITRALGMEESLRVPVRSMRVYDGDVYLLCSDGLSGSLSDDQIESLLEGPGSPGDHVRALIDAALHAGAHDNIATVVIRCHETDVAPQRRPSNRPPGQLIDPPPASHRAPLASAPEIIIVGVETHVVPANSANANLLDALGRFARLRQMSVPEIAQPKPARCGDCGQPLDKDSAVCPTCGKAVPS
jgi:serine/threonine protein phosphatase PrpC